MAAETIYNVFTYDILVKEYYTQMELHAKDVGKLLLNPRFLVLHIAKCSYTFQAAMQAEGLL
jgi:hypothetical protein